MAEKTRKQQLEEMLLDTPGDAELRYFLAMEHLSAGENEAALRCLQEVLTTLPHYVPAYVQLGQLYARLGREEEARKVYLAGIAVARAQGDLHAAGEMEGFLESM